MLRIVHSFAKNGRETVQASLDEYQGHQVAALRVYVPTNDGSSVPTQKGLTLSVSSLPDLKIAVDRLCEAAADLPPRAA